MQGVCVECGIRFVDMPSRSFCTKAPLDWNLAMKMRDEVIGKVGTVKYYEALEQICPYEDKSNMGFWVSIYGFPHHYILAAILAGEG